MAKMLGQDLFTQDEFNAFKEQEFDKIVGDLASLNENKADGAVVQLIINKMKSDINKLYVIAISALLSNIGLLYYVSVLLKR